MSTTSPYAARHERLSELYLNDIDLDFMDALEVMGSEFSYEQFWTSAFVYERVIGIKAGQYEVGKTSLRLMSLWDAGWVEKTPEKKAGWRISAKGRALIAELWNEVPTTAPLGHRSRLSGLAA